MISHGKREPASKAQKRDVIGAWIFCALWCGISFPIFYWIAFRSDSLSGAVISGILALFGVLMLWTALGLTMDYMKFGAIALTPQQAPMRTGGTVSAIVEFLDNAPATSEIEAELKCLQVTWSRGSRGSVAVSEETAWSQRHTFRLRNTGLNVSAVLSFNIPPDARPTDLPGEGPGDAGWTRMTLKTTDGSPQHYYRWEIQVTAKAPGLDLDRVFKVTVEPGDEDAIKTGSASRPLALSYSEAPPKKDKPARIRNLTWVGPGIVVLLAGSFFFDSFKLWWNSSGPAQPIPQIVNVSQWVTRTNGWTLPMPTQVRHVGIAAERIKLDAKGGKLRWQINRVAIEKPPSTGDAIVDSLEVLVQVAKGSSRKTRSTFGVGDLLEVGTTLTTEKPALVLDNVSTPEVDATFCEDGKCSIFLTVWLKMPGAPSKVQEVRRLNVF
jgi:hypothetical protein